MIHYSLTCDRGHAFEGWFSQGADYDRQKSQGLISCPVCGSVEISKGLMAPSVSTARQKSAAQALAVDQVRKDALVKVKEFITAVRANSEDVGTAFPEEARKIHYGEADQRGIIGQASPAEAKALVEEGIQIAPLPVLPDDAN